MNAFLILCHKPPLHLSILAQRHSDVQFYVHYDAKSPLIKLDNLKNISNIHLIRHRIAINWGGFSMIEATLALFQAALSNKNNQYFHLINGDCVPLVSPEKLAEECSKHAANTIWLNSENRPNLRYRTRFNAIHADTAWQQQFVGEALTFCLKWADKLLPNKEICLTGSQWFSANRAALQILFNESLGDAATFFEKKLMPQEHFFQYLVAHNQDKLNHINNNHQYVRFSNHATSPDFLILDHLWQAMRDGFWFAQNVSPENILRFFQYETDL
jgi:hypothetical protein